MKRLLLGLVVLALMAGTGFAHGGNYRGPAGEVPPNMRKPEDPPPPNDQGTPTPPPEENPGTPTPPDNPNPGRPAPGGPPGSDDNGGPRPVAPRAPGADNGGPGTATQGGRRPGGPPPTTFDAWDFWWGYNKEHLLNLKARLKEGEAGAGTEGGILGLGKTHSGSTGGTQAPTDLAIQNTIIPALERVLDDLKQHFDIRAGAVIALGKVGSTQKDFA